jgi:hypothetical protein
MRNPTHARDLGGGLIPRLADEIRRKLAKTLMAPRWRRCAGFQWKLHDAAHGKHSEIVRLTLWGNGVCQNSLSE